MFAKSQGGVNSGLFLYFVLVLSDILAPTSHFYTAITEWSTVMNLAKEVLKAIVVAIVSGYVALWAFGTPELEYKSGYRDKFFNIYKAPDDLTLVYKGERIENISIFDFNIFNRTLKDISGVRLYFKITPKGDGKVYEIISKGVYPPAPLPEIGITEKQTEKENLYAFDIETLKRTGGNSFYTARFIFKGRETPEIAVSTFTSGVDIKEYSYWRDTIITSAITILVMALIYLPLVILGDWWGNRTRKRKLAHLSEALENSALLGLTSEQRELVVNMCDKEFDLRPSYFYLTGCEFC
jgi:hypothetical protein